MLLTNQIKMPLKALVLKEKINRKKTKKLSAVPEKTLPDLIPRMEKFLGIF